MTQIASAVLAGTMAGLVFVVLHYLAERILGRPMPRLWAYISGTATLGAAFSLWVAFCEPSADLVVVAFWVITAIAGGMDIACYALDAYLEMRAARREAEMLREKVDGASDGR